jgi:hypothetical protein
MLHHPEAGLIPVLVVLFIAFILWLSTRGWRDLARVYPLRFPFSGRRWFFQSARLGDGKFGGVLIVGSDHSGVYFSTIFPATLCPPIFIPWNEIEGLERKGILTRLVQLKFAQWSERDQYISGRLADKLEEAAAGAWTYQRSQKKSFFGKD